MSILVPAGYYTSKIRWKVQYIVVYCLYRVFIPTVVSVATGQPKQSINKSINQYLFLLVLFSSFFFSFLCAGLCGESIYPWYLFSRALQVHGQ